MKKIIFHIILLAAGLLVTGTSISANTALCSGPPDTNDIVIGKTYTIHSEILGEDRQIFIHVPEQYLPDYDTVHYPVMYVFDADQLFQSTVALMTQLSSSLGDQICPKMIVVGIKQNDRDKDLGLKTENGILPANSMTHDLFTVFIAKEVQPYVDANFRTLPYRTLTGYSLGGLKVMNIIAYNPDLFNAYIIIDPSVGHYNNQWYLASIQKIEKADLKNKSVFLAMAQTMKMGTDTSDVKKDTTTDSRHMRDIMQSAEAFRKNRSSYDFNWKYYPDEYHGSVPLIAMYDAFYEIFDWFNLQKIRFILQSDDSPEAVKEAIKNHFEKASQLTGMRFLPPEYYLTEIVIFFYTRGNFEKTLAVSELLIENYPESPNAIKVRQILLEEEKMNKQK